MKERLGKYDAYLDFTPFNSPPLEPQGDLFLVCLGKTPNFPQDLKVDELARNQLSVCCLRQVAGGTAKASPVWGWAALGGDLKDMVARRLLAIGAAPGFWYWMELKVEVPEPKKRTSKK